MSDVGFERKELPLGEDPFEGLEDEGYDERDDEWIFSSPSAPVDQ